MVHTEGWEQQWQGQTDGKEEHKWYNWQQLQPAFHLDTVLKLFNGVRSFSVEDSELKKP